MQLENSVRFDPHQPACPGSEPNAFFNAFPRSPAVFALFFSDPNAQPYLGRTRDLHRRMVRLLARRDADSASGARPLSKILNLRDVTRLINYQLVGSAFEAQWLLYQLNRTCYPAAYRQRMRLKPPALLKLNLRNRFPRCYPTRRLSNDGSLYYGPFPSRAAADRFAGEFLDLFKIRRCFEDLDPDPSHPGCIYSQMQMCLAPCFQGCTDEEYQQEVGRVTGFLDSEGHSLVRLLEAERSASAEALEFEQAAKVHRRLEKVQEVVRLKPALARNLRELNALIVERAAAPKSIAFFRVAGGEIRGPAKLSLDERVSSPVPLDEQLRERLDALAGAPRALPPWEHLSLLSRWYYSSFRDGEIVLLPPGGEIPHARVIRLCRKILAAAEVVAKPTPGS